MYRCIYPLIALVLLSAFGECGDPPFTYMGLEVAQQQTYSARGLYTFPNNLSEVPDGSFSRADDGVIRRDGVIETRRGFKTAAGTLGAAGDRFDALHDFNGTLVGHTTANTVATYNGTTWSAFSGTYTPPTGKKTRFLKTGKSLYFTTNAGVKRLDALGSTVYDAGVPQALAGTVALSSNGAHATGTVTLSGGAGNVTITVGGTAVGPVAFNTSDAQTALDCITALNANATVSALVTASSGGSAIILLTAKQAGTAGNSITLTASRTAGAATASGATLTGGSDGSGWFPADAQTAYRLVWGTKNVNDRVILGAPSGRMPLTNPSTETLDTVVLTIQVPSWVTSEHFLQVYRADTSATAGIPASDDMSLVYEAYPTASEITARSMTITDVTPDELKGAPLYSSPNSGVPGSEKFQPPVCTDLADYKERMWCVTTTQRQRVNLTLLSVDSTSGGMADGMGILIGGTGFYAGPAEIPSLGSTVTFKRYTDGTATQNVANTAQSLVRMINANQGIVSAFYVSGEYDSPGQLVIEANTLGDSAFEVKAIGGWTFWQPALRLEIIATNLARAANVVTATVGAHGIRVGDTVTLGTDPSPPNFPAGTKTVTAITPTSFSYAEVGTTTSVSATIIFNGTTPPVLSDPTAAPNGLAYSEYQEPDAVPLGNYMAVGSPNYSILRIIPLGDTLFIFKEEAIYTLTGDSPQTFSVRQFPTPAKMVAPETAVVLGNAIYVVTDQGVMAISESGTAIISRPIEATLKAFYDGSAALKTTLAATAFAVSYETEREYHLFLPTDASSTYATQAYVYNYVTKAWTRWTKPATSGYVLPSSGLEYLGKATGNAVLVERKTLTTADYQDEDNVPITLAVDWQVRTGENPGGYKHWQKVTCMLEQPAPSQVLLSLGTEVASTTASGTMTVNGLPYVTSYVPVDQSRSQTLTVGLSGGEVSKLLAIKGLSVNVLVPSTKLR